jgi:hypothetical protein
MKVPLTQLQQASGTLTRLYVIIMNTMSNDARFEALQSAPLDSWVALSEDETKIVAVGSSYTEAVEKSERAGVSDPVLVKTPKAWHSIAV